MRLHRQDYAETLYDLYETCRELYFAHCKDEEIGWNAYDRQAQKLIAKVVWYEDWGCDDDGQIVWYYEMIHKAINYFDRIVDWEQIFLISRAIYADILAYEDRHNTYNA